jgi:hypothetical protein
MVGGYNPGRGWEILSSPLRPDRLWGPPCLLSTGYQGLSLGVKRPGRGAIPPLPNTPPWRGAQLEEVQGHLYPLPLPLLIVYINLLILFNAIQYLQLKRCR